MPKKITEGLPRIKKISNSFILVLVCGASQVALVVKNLPANARDIRDVHSIPQLGRSPGEGHRFLPGESPGQGSLVGYSSLGHKELDTTEVT